MDVWRTWPWPCCQSDSSVLLCCVFTSASCANLSCPCCRAFHPATKAHKRTTRFWERKACTNKSQYKSQNTKPVRTLFYKTSRTTILVIMWAPTGPIFCLTCGTPQAQFASHQLKGTTTCVTSVQVAHNIGWATPWRLISREGDVGYSRHYHKDLFWGVLE